MNAFLIILFIRPLLLLSWISYFSGTALLQSNSKGVRGPKFCSNHKLLGKFFKWLLTAKGKIYIDMYLLPYTNRKSCIGSTAAQLHLTLNNLKRSNLSSWMFCVSILISSRYRRHAIKHQQEGVYGSTELFNSTLNYCELSWSLTFDARYLGKGVELWHNICYDWAVIMVIGSHIWEVPSHHQIWSSITLIGQVQHDTFMTPYPVMDFS